MKRTLSMLAFSGLVALGLVAGASSSQAAAIFATGAAAKAVNVVETANTGNVFEVDHRRRHWHRRHHRRHHGSGFYLEFGTGGYHHRPPYYHRPPPYYGRPPVYARPPAYRPRPAYRVSNAHVRWCHARYRSYRAWDNTFQPYHGPRRACISPYWR